MEEVGTAAAAYAMVKAASRVLGPASDEVAEAIKRWTALRVRNIGRIVENAESKVLDPDSPGSVPMRVLMQVVEDGSYSDEDVVVEYLGGVLASSRTASGRDDRGIAYSSLINGMSSFELRLHFVIYRLLRQAMIKSPPAGLAEIFQSRLFIPAPVIAGAMELPDLADEDFPVFTHALYGLVRRNLVGETFGFGPGEQVIAFFRGADFGEQEEGWKYFDTEPVNGVVVTPTRGGAELFMWGLGLGQSGLFRFFEEDQDVPTPDFDLSIGAGSLVRTRSDAIIVAGGVD